MPKEPQLADEAVCRSPAARELQTEHAAVSIHLERRDLVVRMRLQPGVMNNLHFLALLAPARDAQGILVLAPHAHVQRLEAALQHPAGERVRRLSPYHHLLPHLLDVRRRAEHGTTQHVVMAVEELGRRMDDDVRAMFERTEVDWAGERRVHHQREAVLLRQVTHRPQVQHAARRVHGRLEEHGSRLLPDALAPAAGLMRVHQRDTDAERGEFLGEQL